VCLKEFITIRYHQLYCSKKCKNKFKSKIKESRRRDLNWYQLYDNPFHHTEKIDYHHISKKYVVPIPSDIHFCYIGYHTHDVNKDLDYIVEQIYPSFVLIKNSIRN